MHTCLICLISLVCLFTQNILVGIVLLQSVTLTVFCMLIPSHKSPVARRPTAQTAYDKIEVQTTGYPSSASLLLGLRTRKLKVNKRVKIGGREVRTVRRMVQYISFEFFQKSTGDVRGMGPRVVVEQAHSPHLF